MKRLILTIIVLTVLGVPITRAYSGFPLARQKHEEYRLPPEMVQAEIEKANRIEESLDRIRYRYLAVISR